MAYQPHERRVLDEAHDLDVRRAKLEVFCAGRQFPELSDTDQFLLMRQGLAMREYFDILRLRIAAFEAKKS